MNIRLELFTELAEKFGEPAHICHTCKMIISPRVQKFCFYCHKPLCPRDNEYSSFNRPSCQTCAGHGNAQAMGLMALADHLSKQGR